MNLFAHPEWLRFVEASTLRSYDLSRNTLERIPILCVYMHTLPPILISLMCVLTFRVCRVSVHSMEPI